MRKEQLMDYRAQVRIDFDGMQGNDYQKLVAAFTQLGWQYVQTTSFAVETPDIGVVLRAFEILAKQIQSAGTLTGLSFDIQGSDDFAGVSYPAIANHPNALEQIRAKPFP
jgi:hypothetical protein